MKEFFEAKKIAVIGAAREKEKVGNIIFRNLLKNRMIKVFPVNPNTSFVENEKSYPDVLSIPFNVDLAIIVIPALIVPQILEQCGRKGIKNVIIISAGFSESGNNELNEKIKILIDKFKFNVIGPNVLGIISSYKELNASFYNDIPEKGNISLVSQSGALGTAILDKFIQNKIGMSCFMSIGNMLQQDFNKSLEFLEKDPYTEIILLYVESLKENSGKEFIEICKRISKRKKIIVLKSGKTEKGIEAAKTHTASLSSSEKIYSSAFKQSGIIEVNSLRDMMILATIFSKYKNLGKRGVIVSNAGGLAVLTTDVCAENNIELSNIPSNILTEMDKIMPKGYSRKNPIDILGDALGDRYEKVLKLLDKENWFDFFIILVTPQAMTQPFETARAICSVKKPIFSCFIGGKSFDVAKKVIEQNKLILFEDVSDLSVLGKL